jgi:hypothetical protein
MSIYVLEVHDPDIHEIKNKMVEWCNENCQAGSWYIVDTQFTFIKLYDAMMFKMTFGNGIICDDIRFDPLLMDTL